MTRARRESRPPLEPRNLKEVVNNLLRAETRSFMGVKNCNVSSPLVLMGGKMPLFVRARILEGCWGGKVSDSHLTPAECAQIRQRQLYKGRMVTCKVKLINANGLL